jgi:hypothetical protein
VFEETGYDITLLAVNDKQHYCERKVAVGATQKTIGLFLVPGVDDRFPFCQQCEGEIESYSWFFIDDLAKMGAGVATISAGQTGGRVRLLQVCFLGKPFFLFIKNWTSEVHLGISTGKAI